MLQSYGNPSTTTVDATNNWWGTTDVSAIAAKIYDFSDSSGSATANWSPYLNNSSINTPTITNVSPNNGAISVSVNTTIVVTFNVTMNKTSVQEAFSITPNVIGNFSWADNDMIFTPSNALAFNTTYTMKISTTAQSISGNHITSDYTWGFITEQVSQLDHIAVTPSNPSVALNGTQTFTAQGYDQYNSAISGLTYTWNCTNQTAGSINSSTGVFTAGTVAGTYINVIQATSGGKIGYTSVIIVVSNATITTNAATAIGTTTGTLNGTLNNLGSASSVSLSFEYWKGTDTPISITATPATATANNTNFSANLSNLLPGTTYTFHAVAVGTGTPVQGNNLTFTTPTSDVLRVLPTMVSKGQSFNVTVTFIAPADNLNAVGLTDFAPSGWTVVVNNSWNTPNSDTNNVTANRADYIWNGPFTNGTPFTAVYQVTVPTNATTGEIYSFSGGTLEYYVGTSGPTIVGVFGNSQVQVMNGAIIQGKTYEAKCLILAGVTLTMDGTTQIVSGVDGTYQLLATTTGSHTIVATKTGYRSQTQTVNVTDLTATYILDFKAGYGLVPKAPDLSYVLACINKWKFPPIDGTGLDISKVLSVINAWKFPIN